MAQHEDNERLLQLLVEQLNRGDRGFFDRLSDHEKRLALQILDEYRGSGASVTLDALWEVDVKAKPPNPADFLSEYYIGEIAGMIFPQWREDIAHVLDPRNGIIEHVLTGGVGAGKTTVAIVELLYKLCVLTCLRAPQKYYNLGPATPIVLAFFNVTREMAG